MKRIVFVLIVFILVGCNERSPLQGHTYQVIPLTSLLSLRQSLVSQEVKHHYASSSNVEVIQYINGEPFNTESLRYGIYDSIYIIDGQKYIIRRDTAQDYILLIDGNPIIRLKYVY